MSDELPFAPGPDSTRRAWLAQAVAGGAGLTLPGTTRPGGASRLLMATDFGTRGDGIADDTVALQAALNAAATHKGASLHLPAGRYRVTRSLMPRAGDRFDLTGDGASTTLLHENDEPLLHWPENVPCRESSIRHLAIVSTGRDKSPATPAILCAGGSERSFFGHLLFISESAEMGGGVHVDRVADTTTFNHCLLWGPIRGTGLRIARGSEVRIIGGRILGSRDPYKGVSPDNVGVHLTGNNGGVHLVTTDLIGLGTGIKIGEPGQTSNREVFLTHATLDSCVRGLWQIDNAYTSISGCWAASSDEQQILIDQSAANAILSISGGCIFNGGAYGRPGAHDGLVVRAGTFSLNGVLIRHNKGTGLSVGPRVNDYAVTGCRFTDNGIGADLDGGGYAFTGNVLARNGKHLTTRGPTNASVTANVMSP